MEKAKRRQSRRKSDRRRPADVQHRRELLGRLRRPPAVGLHHLGTALEREEHRSGKHRRADRVRSEAERRDHPEVAAAAPESPQQLGVVVLARGDQLPVRRDDVGPHEVVDAQTVLAGQPPDPAAEGETGDARVRHDPGRDRQPERLRCAIELAEVHAGLDLREAVPRLDPDALQRGQVDDQAVVAEREATHAVPAAPHRHPQVVLARESHRAPDVRRVRTPGDEPRPPVDRAVPDRARLVVSLVRRGDQPAVEALAERSQGRRRHRGNGRVVGPHRPGWCGTEPVGVHPGQSVGLVTMRNTMAITSTASTIPTVVPRCASARNSGEPAPEDSNAEIWARRVGV